MKKLKHKPSLILLCVLHIFLGINGLTGGLLLIIKPDGSLLGMQMDLLNNSPFSNYLIPGVLLLLFLGGLPLFTFYGLIKRSNWKWVRALNIYRDRYWSWSFSLYTGIIAIFWITIQLLLTQYFWIQPIIIFVGLFIIVLTMVPQVMEQYKLQTY